MRSATDRNPWLWVSTSSQPAGRQEAEPCIIVCKRKFPSKYERSTVWLHACPVDHAVKLSTAGTSALMQYCHDPCILTTSPKVLILVKLSSHEWGQLYKPWTTSCSKRPTTYNPTSNTTWAALELITLHLSDCLCESSRVGLPLVSKYYLHSISVRLPNITVWVIHLTANYLSRFHWTWDIIHTRSARQGVSVGLYLGNYTEKVNSNFTQGTSPMPAYQA